MGVIQSFLMVLALTTACIWAGDNKPTDLENTILTLVLKRTYPDHGYTVVNSGARLFHFEKDSKSIKESKEYIRKELKNKEVDQARLVERLFERNKQALRLSIKSSEKDGYIFDYDGKYAAYFEKDGGGWVKWYQENPKAHGNTTVSLPVYDAKSGLVLVYTGSQTHWRAGSGWVILYKYEKGELKELKRVMMWVS